MVGDLIADAMAGALGISVRPNALDPAILVGDVAEANRAPAAGKEQVIATHAERDLRVEGDMERLRAALDNLVSNAVKYSPVGGSIIVQATRQGGEAIICVADEGPGLLPEDTGRLFGRFQRLSPSRPAAKAPSD